MGAGPGGLGDHLDGAPPRRGPRRPLRRGAVHRGPLAAQPARLREPRVTTSRVPGRRASTPRSGCCASGAPRRPPACGASPSCWWTNAASCGSTPCAGCSTPATGGRSSSENSGSATAAADVDYSGPPPPLRMVVAPGLPLRRLRARVAARVQGRLLSGRHERDPASHVDPGPRPRRPAGPRPHRLGAVPARVPRPGRRQSAGSLAVPRRGERAVAGRVLRGRRRALRRGSGPGHRGGAGGGGLPGHRRVPGGPRHRDAGWAAERHWRRSAAHPSGFYSAAVTVISTFTCEISIASQAKARSV